MHFRPRLLADRRQKLVCTSWKRSLQNFEGELQRWKVGGVVGLQVVEAAQGNAVQKRSHQMMTEVSQMMILLTEQFANTWN